METTENTKETEENIEAKNAGEEISEENSETSTDNVEEIKATKEEDFKEKYYYLAAEMQNMQRRADKDRENLLKFGNEKLLNDMIDVVDNLERTLGFISTDEDEKVKNIVVGVEMIHKMFLDNLAKHGLKQVEAMGLEFDPHFHEALAQQPSEGKKDNEIIQVLQTGYILNDRVIRAAKVIITKNA